MKRGLPSNYSTDSGPLPRKKPESGATERKTSSFSHSGCSSESEGGVVGVFCASFAARLANFFCSRRSALARCFSCRFISFWRFWKVILIGLLRSGKPTSAVLAAGGRTRGNPHPRIRCGRDHHRGVRRRYCCAGGAHPWAALR